MKVQIRTCTPRGWGDLLTGRPIHENGVMLDWGLDCAYATYQSNGWEEASGRRGFVPMNNITNMDFDNIPDHFHDGVLEIYIGCGLVGAILIPDNMS